jgi:hypothetical protein
MRAFFDDVETGSALENATYGIYTSHPMTDRRLLWSCHAHSGHPALCGQDPSDDVSEVPIERPAINQIFRGRRSLLFNGSDKGF